MVTDRRVCATTKAATARPSREFHPPRNARQPPCAGTGAVLSHERQSQRRAPEPLRKPVTSRAKRPGSSR